MSTDDSNVTRPTLETVLERFNSLEERMNQRFDMLEERMNARFDHIDGRLHHNDVRLDHVDTRFDDMTIRLDRIEGLFHSTRGDVLVLRADFNELQKRLREHFQSLP